MHSFDMVEVKLRFEYALVEILWIYDPDLAQTELKYLAEVQVTIEDITMKGLDIG